MRRTRCSSTVTSGLSFWIVWRADSVLGIPTRSVSCRICRCRFDSSTTSSSTIPSRPTPAAARYSPAGEPSPPAPISSTLALSSFACPARPPPPGPTHRPLALGRSPRPRLADLRDEQMPAVPVALRIGEAEGHLHWKPRVLPSSVPAAQAAHLAVPHLLQRPAGEQA